MSKQKKTNKIKQKTAIKCECDFIVTGNSEDNARANLKLHLKSNKHKKLIAMKQDIANGEIKDISGSKLLKQSEVKK